MNKRWALSILSGLVLIVLLAGLATHPSRAQAPTATFEPPAPFQTISVTGSGQSDVQPDLALVSLGVSTQAKTANAAITTNNQSMQAVVKAIQAAGVQAEDIQTQVLQLQPQSPPIDNQNVISQTITGYLAANIVQVKVRNLNRVGDILDAGLAAGANRIDDISFQVNDPTAAEDQARAQAMSNARHKAEQLAGLANAHLGDVISISEESLSPLPFTRSLAAPQAAGVPIQAGTQSISANVRVTWALIPGGASPLFPLTTTTSTPLSSGTPFSTSTSSSLSTPSPAATSTTAVSSTPTTSSSFSTSTPLPFTVGTPTP